MRRWRRATTILPLILLVFFFSSASCLLHQCYGRYGCFFPLSYPWLSSHRIVPMMPKSPREIHPDFFLFTRGNPRRPRRLTEGDEAALAGSNFDASK